MLLAPELVALAEVEVLQDLVLALQLATAAPDFAFPGWQPWHAAQLIS